MELSKLTLEIFSKLEHKWLSHCKPNHKTRILSIDGGGTTAIVAGQALIHLEDQIRLRTSDPQAQLADFFDIVAGTGIGAILAAMITAGDAFGRPMYTAREAVRLVSERNSELYKFKSGGVFRRRRKISSRSMDNVLKQLFQRKEDGRLLTLKDTCKPLLIPCFDLKSSAPFVFSRADASESPSFDFELWKSTCSTPSVVDIVLDGVSETIDQMLGNAFCWNRTDYVRIQAFGLGSKAMRKEEVLKERGLESLPFGGKRLLTETNGNRIDSFVQRLVATAKPSPPSSPCKDSAVNSLANGR
ncbi:inactive patatin-like protein [Vigna angularis]|uniref:Patatin n=1 Tax=Phaseolus angularis TaxID=3914 RepID=A0A8T0KRH8_PHAAN|nr:inactive patatin-like protein [Vigna angularis]